MANTGRSEKMTAWWAEPANKDHVKRVKLEAQAERLGTTVEALERPRVWAPVHIRRQTYRDLFLDGKTMEEIMKLYPREHGEVLRAAYVLAERVLYKPSNQVEEGLSQKARTERRRAKLQATWTPEKRAEHSAKIKAADKKRAEERAALLNERLEREEHERRERRARRTKALLDELL